MTNFALKNIVLPDVFAGHLVHLEFAPSCGGF